MRRSLAILPILALLVALPLLTGCGDQARVAELGDEAAPTDPSDSVGDPEVVTIVSGSAADGEVVEEATVLAEAGDLTSYLEQFDSPTFVADLRAAVRAVPPAEGRVVGVAVIAIGCDAPPTATVTEVGDVFVVMPGKIVNPHYECFAPVTSVAVLDLPRR